MGAARNGTTDQGDMQIGGSEGGSGATGASPAQSPRDRSGRFLPRDGASKAKPALARSNVRRKAGLAGAGARRGTARKAAPWSARREAIFLETLAETSNVAESIRQSGLSETSVYRMRRKSAEFRAKWATALREGFVKLESQLLDRALNGVEKAIWHGGKQVGTTREFNDRAALALLAHHRPTVMGERAMASDVPVEELRARLKAKLSEMNKRMGGAG